MSWLDKFFGKNYNLIQYEGVLVPPQPQLDFEGAGVTVTDDPSQTRTKVTKQVVVVVVL